jgi:hypothetical protein
VSKAVEQPQQQQQQQQQEEDDDDGGYKTVPTPITRTFRLCIITIIVNTY